jgi:hypothetical protein
MAQGHSTNHNFEAERDLIGNLVELNNRSVNVYLGVESYQGTLYIETDKRFTHLQIAVAVDGDPNRMQRTQLYDIREVDSVNSSIRLKERSSAGGAGV